MVTLGWLSDQPLHMGGAELSGRTLIDGHPNHVEIVFCPSNRRPSSDIDVFVLQNVVGYSQRWIDVLAGHPIVKHFRDPWHPGDVVFRRWVLDHTVLTIHNSALAMSNCPWALAGKTAIVPPPVDLDVFRAASQDEREGNIYMGRVDMNKGIHRAADWALREREPLDVYGPINMDLGALGNLPPSITFHGEVSYARVPRIMGAAQRFVMLPGTEESYSRTVVEAWAAGCELVVDWDMVGAHEWMVNGGPLEKDEAVAMFWAVIEPWL